MSDKKTHIIVTPHCDDEIIGNYSIISNPKNKCIIIYSDFDMTDKRQAEMVNVKKKFDNIKAYMKARELPSQFLSDEFELYYPDPFFETHPHHRLIGNKGYDLFLQGYPINFYTINMQAPYVYNVTEPEKKKAVMDDLFPSQRCLWKNDAKYYLFEGHCSYIPERIFQDKLIYKHDGRSNLGETPINEVESEVITPEVVE